MLRQHFPPLPLYLPQTGKASIQYRQRNIEHRVLPYRPYSNTLNLRLSTKILAPNNLLYRSDIFVDPAFQGQDVSGAQPGTQQPISPGYASSCARTNSLLGSGR